MNDHQQDADRCAAEARRLRNESRIAQVRSESFDLLAEANERLAEMEAEIQRRKGK